MPAQTTTQTDTVYVVRHARAGRRTSAPDDESRSLSGRGRQQADRIRDVLGPLVSGPILSSPYPRCVQTVQPLAELLGTRIDIREELAEGSPSEHALRLLVELPGGSVACVHGDLLTELADQLAASDCHIDRPVSVKKGVVWALTRIDGRLAHVQIVSDPDQAGSHRQTCDQ